MGGGGVKRAVRSVTRSVKKAGKNIVREAKKTVKDPGVLTRGKTGGEVLGDFVATTTGARAAEGYFKKGTEAIGAGISGEPQALAPESSGLIDEEAERAKEEQAEFDRIEKERLARGSRTRTVLTGGQGVQDDEDDETSITRRTLAGF